MEVRITDCASSRRLLAEMTTFIAAFLHMRGTKVHQAEPISPGDYRDYLTNRWAAARWGLQATFCWNGQTKPVAEILDEMLDECSEALRVLETQRDEFSVINAMLQKRVCQADFVMQLAERYPEDHALTSAYSKMVRHWNVFEEYLEKATPLEPIGAPDDDAIQQAHLDEIGEGTHFYRSREVLFYPPPVADELVEKLIEKGVLAREISSRRGTVLHRVG
jgi:hypothetical protein